MSVLQICIAAYTHTLRSLDAELPKICLTHLYALRDRKRSCMNM